MQTRVAVTRITSDSLCCGSHRRREPRYGSEKVSFNNRNSALGRYFVHIEQIVFFKRIRLCITNRKYLYNNEK